MVCHILNNRFKKETIFLNFCDQKHFFKCVNIYKSGKLKKNKLKDSFKKLEIVSKKKQPLFKCIPTKLDFGNVSICKRSDPFPKF